MSEMDFELIIGDLNQYFPDPPIKTARYYPRLKVIAVDHWTGEEEEAYMADVLSHEFCHHLLNTKFDRESGIALDNIRNITGGEIAMINDRGVEQAWGYLCPATKFALKCSVLLDQDGVGNGVI